MESKLTYNQRKSFVTEWTESGVDRKLVATVRHDDDCRNGHNTFSLTGTLYEKTRRGKWDDVAWGAIHYQIAKHIPMLAPYIKWHLCSTNGPMHYIANTVYHASRVHMFQNKWYFYLEGKCIRIVDLEERSAMIEKYGQNATFEPWLNSMSKEPNLEYARLSAIWPEATLEQLRDKEALAARLPGLLEEFRKAVVSLGLEY
jgi:hypothetical protein